MKGKKSMNAKKLINLGLKIRELKEGCRELDFLNTLAQNSGYNSIQGLGFSSRGLTVKQAILELSNRTL